MSTPKLYPSQQKAYIALHQFIGQDIKDTFILNGFAGTGKTFLMQELGKLLESEKKPFTFLASTGRAAAILRGKTGFEAKTVHSELYNFKSVDGDGEHIDRTAGIDAYGQMRLMFGLREKDLGKRIYIVDEASMMGSERSPDTSFAEFGSGQLLVDLLQVVGENKVIFVGDPCQLPPIGQRFSPALSEEWLSGQGRNCQTSTLTEIVRTGANSGILVLANKVREYFEINHTTKWVKLPSKNKADITVYENHNALLKEYIKVAHKQKKQLSIAVCRSNMDCQMINRLVRLNQHKMENAPLQQGDVLLVTQNNHYVPLTNGDFVEILSVGERRTRANLHFINVRVKTLLSNKDYEILLCLDVLYTGLNNLSMEQNRELLVDFSRRMRYKDVKPNSDQYISNMMRDPYLNSLRATYGYAVTCHKAQGGEWNEVFLFLNKGMYRMELPELFRWWYTAITRTKKHLHLHDDWWVV